MGGRARIVEPLGAYAAFREGDPGPLTALLAPDVVWHAEGSDQLAVEVRGREAVLEFLGCRRDVRSYHAAAAIVVGRIQGFRLENGLLAECWEWRRSLQALPAAPASAAVGCAPIRPRLVRIPATSSQRARRSRLDRSHAALRRAEQQRARTFVSTLGAVRIVAQPRLAPSGG